MKEKGICITGWTMNVLEGAAWLWLRHVVVESLKGLAQGGLRKITKMGKEFGTLVLKV